MIMGKRHGLLVDMQTEDIAYARRQDRYNCAIVRAIQRQLPEATHVQADAKTIRFTLNYGDDRTRYVFETPAQVKRDFIQPFDSGKDVDPVSFTLDTAIDSYTPHVRSPEEARKHRAQERESRRTQRTRVPAANHTTNRFVIEPEFASDEALNKLREKLMEGK